MVDERKADAKQKVDDARVSLVLERAKLLSLELTSTVKELADLLKNYDKEKAHGT